MLTLQSLIDLTTFRLTNLTWVEILDLLLVLLVFYLLLRVMRRSRSALLLRGVIVLSLVLFIVTLILPLPAFDWLVRGMLITVLVATPIIFQPELRRLLERIGRNTGAAWQVRQTTVEQVVPRLVRAVENMSKSKIGALIALEGNTPLQDITETGVIIRGKVSSELLQTIFYPGSPLHDGAVVVQADMVVAAGCVLPLTERPLYFRRRLGTRHRAAVGLSEQSDALVVVISEETGEISVARQGSLLRPLDIATLRRNLYHFFTPSTPPPSALSLKRLLRRMVRSLWRRPSIPTAQQLMSEIVLLLMASLLALGTWTFVIQATDPALQVRLENIPIVIEGQPPNTMLMTPPPSTVSALIQTTSRVRPTLGSRSFAAVVSLEGLSTGLHSVPVEVRTDVPQVQILSVEPQIIDLELAAVISRTVEVTVELRDRQDLSRAYQVLGSPTATPDVVEVSGPEPLVRQVSQVRASLSLANASASLRELRPVQAFDENGRLITGVTLNPESVQVSVTIRRRFNARDVGVRVVTSGSPPPGYWLSRLSVTPSSVTLQGNPDQLDQIGSYVDTLPVDLNSIAGNTTLQIPLDLPPGIQAVDNEGQTANTVEVKLEMSVRRSNLAINRPVKTIGTSSNLGATVSPPEVSLILSGPLPTLNQIQTDPALVQVLVNMTGLEAGDNVVTPTIIAPDDVQAQIIPATVVVMLPSSNGATEPIVPR